ncbi:MAG: ACT domain-containing protein, partial [Acidimicrobiales bacterium]|nr:ACT domain-containing protein [Acidimicrobiales bacterium]
MGSPNASYSVRLRVELPNAPGTLGKLATAIGDAGGNIAALDIVESESAHIVEDVTVFAIDEEHVARIRTAVEAVAGVTVKKVRDRTFEMHVGGKIEVKSKVPLHNRDDLSMAYTPGVARVCTSIEENPAEVHKFTIKQNTVAIVT